MVSLSAGEGHTRCRVVAVGGDEAVLEPEDRRSLGDLKLPGPASLGFETERHPIMLAGMIDGGPVDGTLRFFVTDHIGVREWRLSPRLAANFEVDVAPADAEGDATLRVTRLQAGDISAGGTFLNGLDGGAGDRFRLTLHIPGIEPPTCTARIVRGTPRGAAMVFEDLPEETGRIIEELIFSVRQQICRRAFEEAERRSTGAAKPISRRMAA